MAICVRISEDTARELVLVNPHDDFRKVWSQIMSVAKSGATSLESIEIRDGVVIERLRVGDYTVMRLSKKGHQDEWYKITPP